MAYSQSTEERAGRYASARMLNLTAPLGAGKDGSVYMAASAGGEAVAVKVFEARDRFERELDCFRRLGSLGVKQVCGHHVPQMLNYDDALGIIEMTVVARPYVLDFATVTLDQPPDFPPEVLRERERHWLWVFGKERWARVQVIIAHFRRMGIHLLDPNPKNIAFGPEEDAAWEASRAAEEDDESDSSPDAADVAVGESD